MPVVAAVAAIPAGEYVPTADERIVMYNVPWSHFEVQLAMRGDVSVPRMAYLDGALELMWPSKGHARTKLSVHVLSADRYHPAERSALLPALDLTLLCTFLDRRSATEAMRDFRDALRAGG
jgi:hypothetical protein